MSQRTLVKIGIMWKELSKQIWTTHQDGLDELENTI
jgi:hypothetical protein